MIQTMRLNPRSTPDLALDLGTRHFLVSDASRVLAREPSLAARRGSRTLTGEAAAEVFAREPGHYEVLRPLQQGVIRDLELCASLLAPVIHRLRPFRVRKPSLLLTVPLGVTDIEREAFLETGLRAGASQVHLISEPRAAAVGLVPDFARQPGVLVVDVGAGITEAVLFSLGEVVARSAVRIGGEDFEEELIRFVRQRYDFAIGRRTALRLLTSLSEGRNEMFLSDVTVKGLDLARGLPGIRRIDPLGLDACLDASFAKVVAVLRETLREAPPELSGEILERGVHLTGGGSCFPRLHEQIVAGTGLRVHADLQPLLGVARGEIRLLQSPRLLA